MNFMKPHVMFLGILGLAGVGCAGLASEPEPEEADVVAKPGDNCEDYVCGGGNSPKFEFAVGFHELHLPGTKAETFSGQQLRITKFVRYGKLYQPKVWGAKLTGVPLDSPDVIAGPTLKGAYLYVGNTAKPLKYVLRIDEEGFAGYWADLTKMTPYYKISWGLSQPDGSPPTTDWKNLCSGPYPADPILGGLPKDALVIFEGDRLDPKNKTVSGPDNTWATFGCAGNLPSKMHLSGFSEAAMHVGLPLTLPAQRQTFVRMMSAAYCGTRAFTVHGQKMVFKNASGTLKYALAPNQPKSIESRWDASGATCLSKARVLANPTPESTKYFPLDQAQKMIDMECGVLPECAGTADDQMGYLLVSANPL